MPAAEQEAAPTKSDHDKLEWKLKGHILRERARKKQEREQEVAEERLRKEREAREQQDVMTLGETREQISQLEAKLAQLKDEKHQLFLQLKKVLNEDDNRRKQIIKDTAEIILLDSSMPANMVHPQLYIQQQQQQQQPPPQQRPPLQQPQAPPPQQPTRLGPINQVPPQTAFKPATPKRGRSPSPPPSQVPVSLYHSYGYKTAPQPQVVTSQYQGSPQPKPPHQYSNQPSAFYPVAPQELSIYYPLPTREPTRNVYEPPRPQAFHMEQKLPDHYALRTPVSHGHVIHPGSMPINQQAPPKGGSITAGYPVRSQLQYQQQPAPQAPTPLYTGQTRPLYQSSGQPLPYPPRD